MEIRNIPDDWTVPLLVIGHGIQNEPLWHLVQEIRKAQERQGTVIATNLAPDVEIEFIELPELTNPPKAETEEILDLWPGDIGIDGYIRDRAAEASSLSYWGTRVSDMHMVELMAVIGHLHAKLKLHAIE